MIQTFSENSKHVFIQGTHSHSISNWYLNIKYNNRFGNNIGNLLASGNNNYVFMQHISLVHLFSS